MMAGEVMHLLAAKWHPLCSQSGLETWHGREEMPASVALGLGGRLSHSATAVTWFLLACPAASGVGGVARAGSSDAGTGLPGMSSSLLAKVVFWCVF